MDIAAQEQINELIAQKTRLEHELIKLRAEYKRQAEQIQKQADDIDQRIESAKARP